MTSLPNTLCIGSVLWDVIGRTTLEMPWGADRPGHIQRIPGGVCLNIAKALAAHGLAPALLSCIGDDDAGRELLMASRLLGLNVDFMYISNELPTDVYMAIESRDGLVAAIADARSLERAGDQILTPLRDGRLGSEENPFDGLIALDGNLTEALLTEISTDQSFRAADLRIAPASPGKALRLMPFINSARGTLYVNLEEACILTQTQHETAKHAALALVGGGASRAIVTNGAQTCCDADHSHAVEATPPETEVLRVTGAGDTFMAAHIAAEVKGDDRQSALDAAVAAAAIYVSTKE